MEFDFDAIVVGSGAGGASFAHTWASAGKSVLLIERGKRPQTNLPLLNEQTTLIEKQPYDDRAVSVNGESRKLYMGGVLGGGTSVYGAAMLRPSYDDFHPGRSYSDQLPRELWDWPIEYEQLRPFYDEAEELFKLSWSQEDDYQPLQTPNVSLRHNLLPLAPINERLISNNRARGLRPFRLPLAIDASKCQRCDSCAGFLCPHGARRSAAQVVDETIAKHTLHLLTNTEVEKLGTTQEGKVKSVLVRNRETKQAKEWRAKCIVLAAGAIGSPAIMLRSGLDLPYIGRNYMMHYSPITVGLFPHPTGASDSFVKQVGFADFYFGTKRFKKKLGLIQSLPAPGPLMMSKSGLQLPQPILRELRKRMLPLVGIIEDLPNPKNRVFLNSDGSIALKHSFSKFDKKRGKFLNRRMVRIYVVAVQRSAFPELFLHESMSPINVAL